MAFPWRSFRFSAELGTEWLSPRSVEERVRYQLRKAGLEPDVTLRLLRKTESIISGSTTIPVLINLSFSPNDLDLYALIRHEGTILLELRTKLGFTVFRRTNDDYAPGSGIVRIHWLRKGQHIINLLIVTGDNAAEAIFRFHSTIVMNFISGYGVLCAYPALTLRKKSIANHGVMADQLSRDRGRGCFEKYEERGISTKDHLREHALWSHHVCGSDKSCPSTFRTLHDDGSLFVAFEAIGTPETPPLFYNGFSSVLWSLGGTQCSALPVGHSLFVQCLPTLYAEASYYGQFQ
ncbi:hypothetical protein R3P38DRAFT_3183528 [Favolaschia claudopus]|uniref:Uncharacterized protein n=1 Tax=Favolaschia claudopus TaxID=2862362 RepID=A0AAW0CB25_9AGAR